MTKKIISCVLCLLLVAVTFCGCSKDDLLVALSIDTDTYDPANEMVAGVMGKTVEATGLVSGDYTYEVFTDGTAAITGYIGAETELVIPGSCDGKTVVALENRAFYKNTSIVSIVFPDSLEVVGNYACMYCSKLEMVSFGANIDKIGVSAFESDCDDTKSEGGGSLKSIVFNGAPEIIRENAFYCSDKLEEIVLPDGVVTIGAWAFAKCYSASRIDIGEGLENLGDHAFLKCRSAEEISIPGTCSTVGLSAFYQCRSLKELTIEEGVTELQKGAFEECESLESVTLPESLTSLGKYAFYNCTLLSTLSASASVVTIGGDVFTGDDDITVFAPAGSALEQYAQQHSLRFSAL